MANDHNEILPTSVTADDLYLRVSSYVKEARQNVITSVNYEMINAYWHIGREIVEEEQRGTKRAGYGQMIIQKLSERLTHEFVRGFGTSNLADIRKFYLTYTDRNQIFHTVRGKSNNEKFWCLSWAHYRLLSRVKSQEARSFYEVEAAQNNWSSRSLERQINTLLFERLSKSKDKEGLLKLAQKGHEINHPIDVIKDPMVLEFLNLPESHKLVESSLEEALLTNIQHFLLELGKGFAFVSRQRRITLNGDHFYVDLVFYHTILKCYVLIDLKVNKLSHADLGQMQLYVNYFNKEISTMGDNPSIGLILCTEKNEAMVQYTLGENNQKIFATQYQFHLPTEDELKSELNREIENLKIDHQG